MSRKVIRVPLSLTGIDNAIQEVRAYREWLKRGAATLLKLLADEGYTAAEAGFAEAEYDGTKDVKVTVKPRGRHVRAVIARGKTVLFIEFGTGVKYPDIHPLAATNGMIRGGYGHHLGRLPDGWRYDGDPGDNGEIIEDGPHAGQVHTYGNPASMSMYYAARQLKAVLPRLVKEAFPDR